MILGFKYFHPLKGEHPNTLSIYSHDIVFRSRFILAKRSLSEIKKIANAINWMVDHKKVRDHSADQLSKMLEESNEYDYLANTLTPYYCLRTYQNYLNMPEIDVISVQWHEIYAVLALTLIDKACDDEIYYSSWHNVDDWLHEWRIESNASTWIMEAMEAITWADGLLAKQNTIDEAKQKLSSRNTAAAIQRHAKTNDAILELAEMYQKGNFKSMRNAAQIYSEKHPDKVSHLAHYNRVRTLTEGLSKFLNGQRRSLKEN